MVISGIFLLFKKIFCEDQKYFQALLHFGNLIVIVLQYFPSKNLMELLNIC